MIDSPVARGPFECFQHDRCHAHQSVAATIVSVLSFMRQCDYRRQLGLGMPPFARRCIKMLGITFHQDLCQRPYYRQVLAHLPGLRSDTPGHSALCNESSMVHLNEK